MLIHLEYGCRREDAKNVIDGYGALMQDILSVNLSGDQCW